MGPSTPVRTSGAPRSRTRLRGAGAPPVLVGHRGCGSGDRAGVAENSVASALAAVERGADWVELDVRRTADDRLVLLHHPTVADGGADPAADPAWLADLTWPEAAALGAESLDDLLAALPAGVGLDLDLKTSLEDALRPPERTTAGLLAAPLAAAARTRPLLVTSFDPAALLHLRGHGPPDARLGLLTWKHFPLRKAVPAAAQLGLDAVAAHVPSFGRNDVDPAPVHRPAAHSIEVAHRAGLDVLAWCPGPDDAVRLAAAGVDGLIVDDLIAVRAALDSALDSERDAGPAAAARTAPAAPERPDTLSSPSGPRASMD